MNFTLYVDESGDQGLENVRSATNRYGSSEYLVFGAALVPNNLRDETRTFLAKISTQFGNKQLHCTDLNHFETAAFCRMVQTKKVLLFGVISKKATLGDYRAQIEGKKLAQDYYNKCCQYLLELVGKFMSEHDYSEDQLSIVFESKNHDYNRLRNYISVIRRSPHNKRAAVLARIQPLSITDETKDKEPLLSLADLTAFSLYQAFNRIDKNFGFPEQRYARELFEKFYRAPTTKQVANHGVKFIKGPVSIGFEGAEMKFAKRFYRKIKDS